MKRPLFAASAFFSLCCLILLMVGSAFGQGVPSPDQRERLLMDRGWRFAFGHPSDAKKDFDHATAYFSYFSKAGNGDGPASKSFDDRAWRKLDLPHDWAVELPFSNKGGYSHGYKTLGRNFPENSIGWYRKTFSIPQSDLGRRISIDFDGVYRNAVVWVNGFYLGQEHSGYAGFHFDITDYLNYGGNNVVAVRVDAMMEEGWFYEGAGIYRHTWLTKTSQLHVAHNGTFVSCEVMDGAAAVTARAAISNEGTAQSSFSLVRTIIDADRKTVAIDEGQKVDLASGATQDFAATITVHHPKLWSPETPALYTLITEIHSAGKVIDHYETVFGIRTLRFDADSGFFLNGKHYLLKGTNNHQDHAGIGAAIPDALQDFRIRSLKAMGSNAYRCSHNPPTTELLDACDRLGMLVLDENRLMGSTPEHLELMKRMIERDRNHPSVFIWSIGNEEWGIEGNITGARIASTMQAYGRQLDSTRRFTYANSGWGAGISTVADVMGFNYIFNGDIDKQHAAFPHQPSMGTEETTSRSTRGVYETDSVLAHLAPIDRTPKGRSIEEGMKFYAARPFLSGVFWWTGFDYRGEPHPFGWPQVASQSGILDLCGFPKDMFYYLKSWWTAEPVLHVFPHWNWERREGKPISLWVYSNCDEIELLLNGKSQGRKSMSVNAHLEWIVPYEPGTVQARGYVKGDQVISERMETAGAPAAITLTPDRFEIKADGEDVTVVAVHMEDAKHLLVPTACDELVFELQGPAKIIGVGNGDPSSHEPDKFIEHVAQVTIAGLQACIVKKVEPDLVPEIGAGAAWQPALNEQGNYNVQATDSLHTMIIRGEFELPNLDAHAELTLLPKSLGEEQSLFMNGHLVARHIKRNDAVQEYPLDHAWLQSGKNIYTIVGKPLVKRFQYDELNTDPGVIRVVTPAQQWTRKLFNGLAQIIIQSTRQSGDIILTATAKNVSAGVLKLRATPASLRPAIADEAK
jgi:beta-galactosidase